MDLAQSLRDALAQLTLELSQEQQKKLLDYLVLMQRWNKTYNLTAIKNPKDMLVQHIFDSLSIVNALRQHIAKTAKIVDVGAGGGLPGVVLAIVEPNWEVLCVDAVEKKTAFIRQVAGTLNLNNLSSVHSRIEEMPLANADLLISRAFASLVDFTTLGGMHIKADAKVCAMKARHIDEEISELEQLGVWSITEIQYLDVPHLDAQRCLIWLNKKDRDGQTA